MRSKQIHPAYGCPEGADESTRGCIPGSQQGRSRRGEGGIRTDQGRARRRKDKRGAEIHSRLGTARHPEAGGRAPDTASTAGGGAHNRAESFALLATRVARTSLPELKGPRSYRGLFLFTANGKLRESQQRADSL